jgi:hypothetical protein
MSRILEGWRVFVGVIPALVICFTSSQSRGRAVCAEAAPSASGLFAALAAFIFGALVIGFLLFLLSTFWVHIWTVAVSIIVGIAALLFGLGLFVLWAKALSAPIKHFAYGDRGRVG